MKIIKTTNAPAAVGTYSQAIMVNGFLFASGQLGINPATGELEPDFKTQAAQVMMNVKGVLEEAGLSFSNVVKTTVFLSDISNFAALNEVYAQYFSEPYPARSAVAVKDLPKGGLVEMEVIAVAE